MNKSVNGLDQRREGVCIVKCVYACVSVSLVLSFHFIRRLHRKGESAWKEFFLPADTLLRFE